MELRHFRRFLTLAEELNFSRAAERLHIEQPPLSRTITELEQELGVKLFERTRRGTKLTFAGKTFLEHVPHIFKTLDHTIVSTQAAAQGYCRTITIAVSHSPPPLLFSNFLARCREEEPETKIRVIETSATQLPRGLREAIYDIGLTDTAFSVDGFVSDVLWEDKLCLATPARHPLLAFKEIPLSSALEYRLITTSDSPHEANISPIEEKVKNLTKIQHSVERVTSTDMMLTLVAAGYGVAIIGESRAAISNYAGVVIRSLSPPTPTLPTYLLQPKTTDNSLSRLIGRLCASKLINFSS